MHTLSKQAAFLLTVLALGHIAAPQVAAMDRIVGVVSSEPGAALVKRFSLARGAVITGIEFDNNDDRITFPKVALVAGPARRLADAAVLAEAQNIRRTSPSHVWVSFPPVVLDSDREVYVVLSFPASEGVRGTGDGAGIAALQLAAFGDCFIAPTAEEFLQPIDVDLAVALVHGGTSKTRESGSVESFRTYLGGASPNPVGAMTRIEFGIGHASEVTIAIYNVSGRVVRIVSEGPRGPGIHSIAWDGKDELGRSVAAGVYLVKLTAGPEIHTQKVVIAR